MSNFKRNFNKYFIFMSILLILALTSGCSSRNNMDEMDGMEEGSYDGWDSGYDEEMGEEYPENSPLEPEKIITTIYMELETINFKESNKNLNHLIGKYKAYVQNSEISYYRDKGNKNYQNAFYVIRVPKDEVDNFKSELSGVGNMTNESTYKDDVTKQYRDSESRLRIIEVKEERILDLLTKADAIEDIIKLENQLNDILHEKEDLKTNLMDMDDQIDFSRLEFHITEVDKLSNTISTQTSFGTRILDSIKESLYTFKNVLQELVIVLIYILPFIVIIGIPVLLIILFIINRRKKNNKNKTKNIIQESKGSNEKN